MRAETMRVALITGAASGIGLGLVHALVARGDRVYAADRDEEALRRAAAAVDPSGNRVRPVVLDVTDFAAVQAAVDRAFEESGRLDLLFNNAGVGLAGEVRDLTLSDWHRVIDVNLYGVVNGVQAAYPRMVAQGAGHIVNTASGAALAPRPGMTPYATAKSAVVALSLSLRAEARAYGVSVSTVCPGFVATGIFDNTDYVGVDRSVTSKVPISAMTADECARRILLGVARDQAVIIPSRYVRLDWMLARLSPGLSLRLAGVRARAFRDSRTAP